MTVSDNGNTYVTYRALMAFGDTIRKEIKEGFEDLKETGNSSSTNHRANLGIGVAATVGLGSLIMNILQLVLLHKG